MKDKFYINKMNNAKTKELIELIFEKENVTDLKYLILQVQTVLGKIMFAKNPEIKYNYFRYLNVGPAFYDHKRKDGQEAVVGIYNNAVGLGASLQFLPPLSLPFREKISVEQLFSIVIHHEIKHHYQATKPTIETLDEYLIAKEKEFKARNILPYMFKHGRHLVEMDAYLFGVDKTMQFFENEAKYSITDKEMASLQKVKYNYQNKKNMYFDDNLFDKVDFTRFSHYKSYKPIDNTVLALEYHHDGSKKSISELLQSAQSDELTNPEIYHYLIGKQANLIGNYDLQNFNEQEISYLSNSLNWYMNYFVEKRKVNHQLLSAEGISQKQWLANDEILNHQLVNSMQGLAYLNETKILDEATMDSDEMLDDIKTLDDETIEENMGEKKI